MTKKEKIGLLQAKIQKDYDEIIKRYAPNGKAPLDKVYYLAHVEEIKWDLLNTDIEHYDFLSTLAINKIIKSQNNVVNYIFEYWQNCCNFRTCNFFNYEDTLKIIKDALENK